MPEFIRTVSEIEKAYAQYRPDNRGFQPAGVIADVLFLLDEVKRLEAYKNSAYSERDKLVAALSKCFYSYLGRHPMNEEWEDDWRWIVFIELPTGQCSWHIHDSELSMFDHLGRIEGSNWDGHTTEEKYARLARLSNLKPEPPEVTK